MKRDLYDAENVGILLEAADIADTDTKTKYVDLAGYQSLQVLLAVGAITGVDGSNYLTPVLQECDSTADGSFTTVDSGDVVGAFTVIDSTSEDSVVQRVCYVGSKRYVRVLLDFTGTGITANITGVYAIVGHGNKQPTAAPTTGTAA